MGALVLLAATSVSLVSARAAVADEPVRPRLALVGLPEALRDAISTSIASWNLEVIAVDETSLSAVMPGTAEAARAVAATHGAKSVVWISGAESGVAIWVYDREQDRVNARQLPAPPPYDDPTAAAIALTVKTLLRHSVVAPRAERFGAGPALSSDGERVPPQPAAISRFGVEVGVASRARSSVPLEPRLLIAASLRVRPPLFAMGQLRIGIGRRVELEDLLGHLSTTGGAIAAGFELLPTPALSARAWLGAGVELTRFALTIPEPRTVSRVNPSVDGGLWLGWRARQNVELGVHLGGSVLIRRQRYKIDGAAILTMPHTELELGLAVLLWL